MNFLPDGLHMEHDLHYQGAEFGPSDVARITGVSPDAQRDWRRRGIIVMAVEGRARFYSEQIAQLLVRKALSDIGVPLTEAQGAVIVGGAMLYFEAMRQAGGLDRSDALTPSQHRYLDQGGSEANSLRYLVVPHPQLSAEEVEEKIGTKLTGSLKQMLPAWPANSLEDIGKAASSFQSFGCCSWSVIDLSAMAAKFVLDAERPVAKALPGAAARTQVACDG